MVSGTPISLIRQGAAGSTDSVPILSLVFGLQQHPYWPKPSFIPSYFLGGPMVQAYYWISCHCITPTMYSVTTHSITTYGIVCLHYSLTFPYPQIFNGTIVLSGCPNLIYGFQFKQIHIHKYVYIYGSIEEVRLASDNDYWSGPVAVLETDHITSGKLNVKTWRTGC